MEPIYKFNNGRGAMICVKCRTIISTGPKTKELFCEKCKPKQDEIMERFIANAKHEGKELTKEEVMKERSSAYEFIDFDKQETTLEEVAEKYKSQFIGLQESRYASEDFINGAKWQQEHYHQFTLAMDDLKSSREGYLKAKKEYELKQQERSYSEEEVRQLFQKYISTQIPLSRLRVILHKDFKEWFERNKKK